MSSLRRRLTRDLFLATAGLVGLGLLGAALAAWLQLVDSFDGAVRARALAVAALTEYESGAIRFDFSEDFLRSFGGEHPRLYFEVRARDGTVLSRSPSLGASDLPDLSVLASGRSRFCNVALPGGRPGRMLTLEVQVKPGDAGPPQPTLPRVHVSAASDRRDLDETLWTLGAVAVGCALLLLLGVAWIVPRVLRRDLAPLERFAEQAEHIDAGSLQARFSESGLPDELRPIAGRLNELLARLERSFERERRFSADLAHELRTPLAELRSLAECSLKWPDQRDPEADRETLAIAAQMETLVSRMLELARSERGRVAAKIEPVDPSRVVLEAWKPFAARAEARGVRPTFALAAGSAQADPALLRSIVANLLENAADYAPAGSEVRISGEAAAGGYALRFSNPAGSLSPDDVPRLFDRFWRKEEARTGGEHAGLGLGLARAFASAMGWSLDAALDERRWIVFTLAPRPRAGAAAPPAATT